MVQCASCGRVRVLSRTARLGSSCSWLWLSSSSRSSGSEASSGRALSSFWLTSSFSSVSRQSHHAPAWEEPHVVCRAAALAATTPHQCSVCVARWPYVWAVATPFTRWRAAFGQHDRVDVEARAWQLRELTAAQVALAGLPRCDQHLLQRLLAAGRREEGLVALLTRRHVSREVRLCRRRRRPRTWLGGWKLRR